MAFGARSGKQLSLLTEDVGSQFRWSHKIDVPTVQVLMAGDSAFAELYWPDGVRHRGSPAVGQCQDGEFKFTKTSPFGGTVIIQKEGSEVGQILVATGKPSLITLSGGHAYILRNEGFLREDWVLVDEAGDALFRVKRVFPDVETSGEIELLGKGGTDPSILLLMMAAWYAVQ